MRSRAGPRSTWCSPNVIMAGGMNGPEMAQKALSGAARTQGAVHVGLCAGSLAADAAGTSNAIDIVNKPFTRNDLTEKVKRALAA